ncbi:MAG TPA: DEAD/DEAH box helicase [Asticcacaulis sp.]|nr:DEAD/DEAH box helicase [Asticcacaulis sp.]
MSQNFKDLGLSPVLLNTLEKEGYAKPTPIQAQAIPILLDKHDLLGIAQTGTGKTAAFALPILQHILTDRQIPEPKSVRVLVLSPTRELASQIADAFRTYSAGLGLSIATIYGGMKYGPQYKALAKGLDILVATPGRLIDHIDQKTIDLRGVGFFVLDEADQMLDMGFVKPIRQIAQRLPHKRQNLFFSATMPKEIGVLASELLTDPKKVEITPEATTAEKVEQSVIFVEAQRKRALLSELYTDGALDRTLVFTRTKRGADRVAAYLQAGGVEAAAIHGDKNQSQRERALQAFRAGKVRALVATDIAARGIDVDNVSHVINYELPLVADAYVHRIGRTARAGRSGVSITFCADDERRLLKDIERKTRQRIPFADRRKDNALRLLDEAILASGNTEKPKTPDRLPEHKKPDQKRPNQKHNETRHSDPDAEFVHKRQRKRPANKGNANRSGAGRPERAERYDPMAAERAPSHVAPQDRKAHRADKARRVEQVRDMDPAGVFEPRADGPRKSRGGKPFGQKGGQKPQKFGGPKPHKPAFAKGNAVKGNTAKPAEGAQFKRKARA